MKAAINPVCYHVIRTTEDSGAKISPHWALQTRMYFWIVSLRVRKLVLS